MDQDIDDVMRRTYRYYYEDGLVETAVGILFFVIGLALLGWLTVRSNPVLGIGMVILSVLLIFGGTRLVQKILPRFKERLIYPRTGKVIYRQDKPTRGRWIVMIAALALAALSFFLPERFTQMALMEGALLGVILSYLGYRVGLARYYLLGGAALLVGLAAVLLFNNDISGSAFTFSGIGLILLVSGLLTFIRYLRHHPQAEVADE